MTTYLLGAATLLLGVTLTGCGADGCVDGENRIRSKVESCGGHFVVQSPSDPDNVVCTAANEKKASDAADAIEAVSCETVRGWYP